MNAAERERAVLETLQSLAKDDIVLVGGYAVNAYVPPRFSVDCDLVVLGDARVLEAQLQAEKYTREAQGDVSSGSYIRYVRGTGVNKVAFDLLVRGVEARQTGVVFAGALFAKHSRERTTLGRVNAIRIRMRIVDPELLFAMKFVAGRLSDIRDLFMLVGESWDRETARGLIESHCKPELIRERAASIKKTVTGPRYRDALQGPFGKIPDKKFESCRDALIRFLSGWVSGP